VRVVALYRVSTSAQEEEGCSLEAQQRRYHELAAVHRWETIGEFRGVESATQALSERAVLQQVLACVRQQQPDAIWCVEQSRLSRGDPLDVALLFRELTERNVKVIVGSDVRDLSSVDGRFIAGVQNLVDRAEAERLRERSLRGKRERALQGKKNTGKAPYGYQNPLPGNPQRGTLQVVAEQAVVVRHIFEMAAAGLSGHAIAKRLNDDMIASAKALKWKKSTIRQMLLNPVYIGTHVSNAWVAERGTRKYVYNIHHPEVILIEGAHEPIISRELWDAVRARLKPPTSSHPNMLTGLLQINGLASSVQYSRDSKFYHCRKGHKREPWVEVKLADAAVWNAFTSLTQNPTIVTSLMQSRQDDQRNQRLMEDIDRSEKLIERLKTRLNRLIDMRADGEIAKDVYVQKTAEAKKELASAEQIVNQARSELICVDQTKVERVVKAVQALVGNPQKLDDRQKRGVLRSVVRRVDLVSDRRDHLQPRSRRGRFTPGKVRRWGLREVRFHLAVGDPHRDEGSNKSSECCAPPPPRL